MLCKISRFSTVLILLRNKEGKFKYKGTDTQFGSREGFRSLNSLRNEKKRKHKVISALLDSYFELIAVSPTSYIQFWNSKRGPPRFNIGTKIFLIEDEAKNVIISCVSFLEKKLIYKYFMLIIIMESIYIAPFLIAQSALTLIL